MTAAPRRRMYWVMEGRDSGNGARPSDRAAEEDFEDLRGGWFLIAPHALPNEWRDRAIPVYMIRLGTDEVHPFVPPASDAGTLDPEERAVARLTARGASPREIAATLHLSRRSVFRRLARLRNLHGAATNAELATKLAKAGL